MFFSDYPVQICLTTRDAKPVPDGKIPPVIEPDTGADSGIGHTAHIFFLSGVTVSQTCRYERAQIVAPSESIIKVGKKRKNDPRFSP